MEVVVNNKHIFYDQLGLGTKDIVMLHGWGQNMEMMRPLALKLINDKNIKNNYRITILDLPGFGASTEPDMDTDVFSYTKLIEDFLKILKIENPIMLGHSFGGRLSIIYASRNKTQSVILFGAPCIR